MEHLLPFSLPPHRRRRTKNFGGQIDLAHFGSNRLRNLADAVAMQTKFLLNDENQRVKAKHTKGSILALSIQVGSVLPQSILILIAMIKYLVLLAYRATVLFKYLHQPTDASSLQSCTGIA